MNRSIQFHYIFSNPKIDIHNKCKRPVISICYIKDEYTGKIARGISICSPFDQFTYVGGRGRAFSRALSAMKNQEDGEPVRGTKGLCALACADIQISLNDNIVKKIKWDVQPSDCLNSDELRIFNRMKENSSRTFKLDTDLCSFTDWYVKA